MNSITRITTSMRGFVVLGITLLFERAAKEKTQLASLTSTKNAYVKLQEEIAHRIAIHHHRQHTL
ncbi:hypothetical protein ACB094_09G056400 [Castanea mollissima]